MITTDKILRKRLRSIRQNLTDEQIYTSQQFKKMLMKLIKVMIGNRRKIPRVRLYWKEKDGYARTDGSMIWLNTANSITHSFPDTMKADSLIGFLSHEVAHLLYSDFELLEKFMNELQEGNLYPYAPEPESEQEEINLLRIQGYLENKDKTAIELIRESVLRIQNILEDVYVELMLCAEFPGSVKRGIGLNNLRWIELMPTVKEEVERNYYKFPIMHNLILLYARAGDVNNWDGYQGEFTDKLDELLDMIDFAVVDPKPQNRLMAAVQIVFKLWPYLEEQLLKIKQAVEEAKNKADEEALNQDENAANEQAGPVQEEAEENAVQTEEPENKVDEIEEDILNHLLEEMLEQMVSASSVGEEEQNDSISEPDEEDQDISNEQDNLQIEPGLAEELQQQLEALRNQAMQRSGDTNEDTDSGTGNVKTGEENAGMTDDEAYQGNGYNAAGDMLEILDRLAEENLEKEVEKEIMDDLNQLVTDIDFGEIHAECKFKINRMQEVPESYIDSYQAVHSEIAKLSDRFAKKMKEVLQEKDSKEKGLLIGNRLDQGNLFALDGRFFTNKNNPGDRFHMAVSILQDESGSMEGDRITYGKIACLMVYEVCRELGIPIAVYGHSTSYHGFGWEDETVEIYSYAEFDSVDRLDQYRLMDMSDRGANRDGAAIRFVAERLLRRQEENKLLIIISDGKPNAKDYEGEEAMMDLYAIKKEYTRKGITIFTAAIGDDREIIKLIYGDSFLNISELKKLPLTMVRLIEKNIA